MKRRMACILVLLLGMVIVGGCSKSETASQGHQAETGKSGVVQFRANGEDFVRQGFTSKDGWMICFDHVYITIANISGYQTDPAYEAEQGDNIKVKEKVALAQNYTIDLAEGDENAEPILVGEVKEAPVGHYNAISWEMVKADEGPAKGYSLVIIGQAEKDGQKIDFTIGNNKEYRFTGGEFIGDERKGFLDENGTTDLEMTFHFDHIFGDAESPATDELNVGALGFAPFAQRAQNGTVKVVSLENDLWPADYNKMLEILPTLGHVGEGHCYHQEI